MTYSFHIQGILLFLLFLDTLCIAHGSTQTVSIHKAFCSFVWLLPHPLLLFGLTLIHPWLLSSSSLLSFVPLHRPTFSLTQLLINQAVCIYLQRDIFGGRIQWARETFRKRAYPPALSGNHCWQILSQYIWAYMPFGGAHTFEVGRSYKIVSTKKQQKRICTQ